MRYCKCQHSEAKHGKVEEISLKTKTHSTACQCGICYCYKFEPEKTE